MDQKINVLIVEPGKEPRPAAVEDTLEAFQQIVGGPIEAGCYLPQRVMLICNGEGKSMGLMPNRENPVDSGDFIAGTFLLCGFEGGALRLPYPCPADAVPGIFRPVCFGGRRQPVTAQYLLCHLVVPP